MLQERLKTAGLLIPLLAVVLWLGGPFLVAAAWVAFVIINHEYFSFALKLDRANHLRLMAIALLLPLSVLFFSIESMFGAFVLSSMLLLALFAFATERAETPLELSRILPGAFLGLAYTGVLGTVLITLTKNSGANHAFIWLFSIVILSDTLAYFGGRAFGSKLFGGAKLAPRISPQKTIAGAVFGLLGALLGSLLSAHFLGVLLTSSDIVLFTTYGLVAGVLAQLGDLVESLVKRCYNVKDSGTILPGHGGLLDRIDALIFAAPILFFLSRFNS